MKRGTKSIAGTGLLAAWLAIAAMLPAQETDDKANAAKTGKVASGAGANADSAQTDSGPETDVKADAAEGEEAEAAPDMQGLELLPVGKTNKGVRLPLYDKDSGKLEFIFNIGELTPVDKERENLDMVDVDIEVMGKSGSDEDRMKIELLTANYNTPHGVLSTNDQAVVRRSDFELVGETMDFDTKRGYGRMTGKTRMTIFNFKQARSQGIQTSEDNVAGTGAEDENDENKKPPLPRMNIR